MDSSLVEAAQALWVRWDAAVTEVVTDLLFSVGVKEVREPPSPITAELPCVATPTPMVTMILAYIVIVLASVAYQKAFPRKVADDPQWVKAFVQCHNLFLVGLSFYMFSAAIYYAIANDYRFWGTGYDPTDVGMGITVYIFYMSKFYEFLDTARALLAS